MLEIAGEVMASLSLAPVAELTLRQSMVASNDGDFYKIHRDDSSPMNHARVMSSLYYVHREPRGFGGGGLRLYDTRVVDGERWWADSYVHIRPDNNSLVFFPSRAYHEVLPVDCQSRSFADSRITINTNFYDAARVAPNAD
jgi:Rps23 Pro-64 3,4-dihydroxylase Tpa1-like proline 4-hydroxylase